MKWANYAIVIGAAIGILSSGGTIPVQSNPKLPCHVLLAEDGSIIMVGDCGFGTSGSTTGTTTSTGTTASTGSTATTGSTSTTGSTATTGTTGTSGTTATSGTSSTTGTTGIGISGGGNSGSTAGSTGGPNPDPEPDPNPWEGTTPQLTVRGLERGVSWTKNELKLDYQLVTDKPDASIEQVEVWISYSTPGSFSMTQEKIPLAGITGSATAPFTRELRFSSTHMTPGSQVKIQAALYVRIGQDETWLTSSPVYAPVINKGFSYATSQESNGTSPPPPNNLYSGVAKNLADWAKSNFSTIGHSDIGGASQSYTSVALMGPGLANATFFVPATHGEPNRFWHSGQYWNNGFNFSIWSNAFGKQETFGNATVNKLSTFLGPRPASPPVQFAALYACSTLFQDSTALKTELGVTDTSGRALLGFNIPVYYLTQPPEEHELTGSGQKLEGDLKEHYKKLIEVWSAVDPVTESSNTLEDARIVANAYSMPRGAVTVGPLGSPNLVDNPIKLQGDPYSRLSTVYVTPQELQSTLAPSIFTRTKWYFIYPTSRRITQ